MHRIYTANFGTQLKKYTAENCPRLSPLKILTSGSAARTAALPLFSRRGFDSKLKIYDLNLFAKRRMITNDTF